MGRCGIIMIMRYAISTLFALFIFGFGFYTPAFAQFNIVPEDNINVEMIPENPGPNEEVYISIESFTTNINMAMVTWKVGSQTKKGIGEKTFSFITGGLNTTTILNITVETAEGQIINKTIKIKPTSVDLLWQTDSFVPPFYKGKPLFSYQNQITFIAIPHMTNSSGVEIGAKNMIYKWSLNGSVIDYASGYGKNTYALIGSIIARPINVSVEVTSGSTDGVGFAQTTVSPVDPFVIFYKKDPLYGIEFQKALINTVGLLGLREITVISMPFFFGMLDLSVPEMSYRWSINGTAIEDGGHQTTQVFRQTEEISGRSNISIRVENSEKILQSASSDFNLEF